MWRSLVAVGVVMAFAPMALAFAATDEDDQLDELVPVSTLEPATATTLRSEARDQLRAATSRARSRLRAARRAEARRRKARAAAAQVSPALEAIAACESGGNPSAVGGGGTYRGKYQFDQATWASVGGSGDPAAAPEAEQDRRAAMLYARTGGSAWPVCAS